jgi:hypothetical protein
MAAAIKSNLQDCPNSPKQTDATSQPSGLLVRAAAHLGRKVPSHDTEDRESDRDEPNVNLENFPQQEWHSLQILFPSEEADENKVQCGNSELKGCGQLEHERKI